MSRRSRRRRRSRRSRRRRRRRRRRNSVDGTGRDGTGPIKVVQEVLAELKSFSDKTPPKTRTVFKLHPAPPMDNVHRRHFYGDHPPY